MRTHVALIRGINVGGNNLIKMADYRVFLTSLGFEEVATLLQSGNAVFTSHGRSEAELEQTLERETETAFKVRSEYVVRTADEWDSVIAANPFPDEAVSDPSHLLVLFAKNDHVAPNVEAVQEANAGPEKLKAVGRHLYIVYPDGIGVSKLPRTPGWNKIGSTGTARNWNTILKIAALLRA